MLAKYSDQLLKKSSKNVDQIDLTVDDIMTLFKFLADKDAFEMHYRKNLAKRLIHGSSKSEADEEMIIQRLQSENSLEYTSKITKMLQDVKLSKNLHNEFSSYISKGNKSGMKIPELEPLILADNVWPFSYQPTEFELPEILEKSKTKLDAMYTSKHSGRVLKWLWPMSRGEVKAHIGKPGKPPFSFTVTIFQMTILTLFNNQLSLTFEQIQERTNLKASQIAANMYPFVKMKLLIQSPEGVDNMINSNTTYTLNKPYRLSKTTVNFAAAVKNDLALPSGNDDSTTDDSELSEAKKAERELNQQRQMFLEACIVRIMKAKRKLASSYLLNERMYLGVPPKIQCKSVHDQKCHRQLDREGILEKNGRWRMLRVSSVVLISIYYPNLPRSPPFPCCLSYLTHQNSNLKTLELTQESNLHTVLHSIINLSIAHRLPYLLKSHSTSILCSSKWAVNWLKSCLQRR